MARKDLWTREQLLLTLNLYHKIPFGQFDHRNLKVIRLAELIGRTPSAVSRKLGNFASFDPYHQSRGVKGLRNAGKATEAIWKEFYNKWDQLVLESETMLLSFRSKKSGFLKFKIIQYMAFRERVYYI